MEWYSLSIIAYFKWFIFYEFEYYTSLVTSTKFVEPEWLVIYF